MGSLLTSLLPYIIGSMLVPLHTIIILLLLKSPRQSSLKAITFVAGITAMRLLQGLVFGLILFDSSASSADGSGSKGAIVSTLLLVLGVILLITAYRKWRYNDDPDAPPPKWLAMIDDLSPLKAFGMGFGLLLIGIKFWVFTLSAIGVIGEAQLGQPASTVAYILFVLFAQSVLLVLIFIKILMPEKSRNLLEQASAWLNRYNRPIVILVSLIFGLLFFYQGASGLLSS